MLRSGASDVGRGKLINRRMFILGFAKVIVFSGIIGRLFSLQISENTKYKTLSDKNRLREWKIAPKRGLIQDYFENIIADNRQIYQLHMIPENVENLGTVFFRLKKIIDIKDKDIKRIKKKISKQKPWEPVIISHYLEWEQFSRVNLFLHELPGIQPVVSIARKYPHKNSFSHVLGYVSEVSKKDLKKSALLQKINVPGLKIGKTGLEKSLDEKLIGEPGYERYEVNALGKRVKEIMHVEGTTGNSYVTTLDAEIQGFISGILNEISASVCVMDIFNGNVVAMVSSPSFDPNKFVHGISYKDWDNLNKNELNPLVNKCTSGLYPPGSTIKPIVALSALEHNVISPKLVVECKGSIDFYGEKFHCWKKKGHGFMGIRNAIKQSCDTYFYEVARRLGVDRLSITARKFGLGERVLSNFTGEKKGVVPNTQWKKKVIGKNWYLGETLLTGIGQGYFQSTPLQLCLMTAQLANGGFRIEPKLIQNFNEDNIIEKGRQNLDKKVNTKYETLFRNQENIKLVNDAMYGATNEVMGTSYRSRYKSDKYMFAGKTGTSQVKKFTAEQRELEVKNKDLKYKDRDHALFTAFFPYKKPKYAISVVVEHGGTGSSSAAPIAKKVIKAVIDRNDLRVIQESKYLNEI